MKKHITPYLLVFLLILILSGGTFYITKKYNLVKSVGGASVYTATPVVRGVTAAPVAAEPASVYGLMNGSCVVIVYGNNGYPNSALSYSGHFNASYDCIRIANHPQNPPMLLSSTGNQITTKSPIAYLANDATIGLLEAKLITLGFLNQAAPTGTFSLTTFTAIKALQTKNSIPATGYLDAATLKVLDGVNFKATPSQGKSFLQIISAPVK